MHCRERKQTIKETLETKQPSATVLGYCSTIWCLIDLKTVGCLASAMHKHKPHLHRIRHTSEAHDGSDNPDVDHGRSFVHLFVQYRCVAPVRG